MSGVLDRDIARAQTSKVREIGHPVFEAVVDHGVGVFERCSATAPDGDENLAVLMSLHHALEMLDGVAELLDESCVVASHPLLRSAFEASLGLRYVLEADFQRRASAYVVADIKDQIRWYEQMDPETPAGKYFRSNTGHCEGKSDFPFPDPEKCRTSAANLRKMLEKVSFKDASDEYDSVAKKRRKPHWYSLFDGPSNLYELAAFLGEADNYRVLYRKWSKTSHAVDLYRQLTTDKDGKAAVRVIRSPLGIATAYLLACNIGLDMSRAALTHYRAGELKQQGKWFLEEVNPVLKQLAAIQEREEN